MLCRCTRYASAGAAAIPGSASHGDEWIDDARAVTAGASPHRSLSRLRIRHLHTATALRSGGRGQAVHPVDPGGWGLSERFDDVALVVSELVTNALRHALPADAPRESQEPAVRLHLMRWTSRLVCAVRDPSRASPVASEAADSAESGRGLFLVESFSDCWGWHPSPVLSTESTPGTAAARGKVVWALFRLTDPV